MATPTETSTSSTKKATDSEDSATSLDDQINALLTSFKGQCKVLEGIGRFTKIVKLHPDGQNIVFNFKITADFPRKLPVIEVRSDVLDEDDAFDLKAFLTQTIEKSPTLPFDSVVATGLDWLKEGKIYINDRKTKTNAQSPKRNKKGKGKKKDKEEIYKPKKPPMKTAEDVIKRFMWDQDVNRDECIVGYIDRLEGLKEKYFNAFSWENIASVDYTVLAIPKHRIQYFKYRGEIVWDKRVRLDNVFGSTGSKLTIKDVIRKMDGGDADNDDGGDDAGVVENQGEREDSDYDSDNADSDSDSDDGITVTIGNGNAEDMYEMGYDYDEDESEGADKATGGENEEDRFWKDKLRPNYFLALRITDDKVRGTVKGIQAHITEHEPSFKPCNIPTNALHITLCTLGLDTPEQVQNAMKCLQNAKHELSAFVPKDKKLKFSGVDHFFNRVVYGKVADCPTEFYEFVEHLKLCLNTQGLEIRDAHDFVPHITIMKISRPVARATGKKYVAPWLYSCFNDTELGYQAIDNLHLCEMGDSRQDDGFYITPLSMAL